jgi:hypothetical protein
MLQEEARLGWDAFRPRFENIAINLTGLFADMKARSFDYLT